jgi:hypothetical protein
MSALVLSLSIQCARLSSANATAGETFAPWDSADSVVDNEVKSVSNDKSCSSDKETDVGLRSESVAYTNNWLEGDSCVGVYMQAMITRRLLDGYLYAWMHAHTHVHMVPYGRQTDRGLKYLFVEDTGSGSVPLS